MRFTAIDIETTGLSPKKERIIEIGAVRYEDRVQTAAFSTLVHLQNAELPERITALTGITEEMLKDAPKETDAMRSLLHFLDGEQILLGHNIPFDYSFLKAAAERMGETFEYQGIDTLALARQCRPELKSRTLTAMCEEYAITTECAHRAEEDAVAAAKLYFHLWERFSETHGGYFLPKPLEYRPKKTEPATKRQCSYLKALVAAHEPALVPDYENLTKSEASRLIDRLLSKYGRSM